MSMDDFEKRLESLATGGHPDNHRPKVGDEIFREALDKFILLRADLATAERLLNAVLSDADDGDCKIAIATRREVRAFLSRKESPNAR